MGKSSYKTFGMDSSTIFAWRFQRAPSMLSPRMYTPSAGGEEKSGCDWTWLWRTREFNYSRKANKGKLCVKGVAKIALYESHNSTVSLFIPNYYNEFVLPRRQD